MLFAIICSDKPDAQAIRAQNRPAHLDYLKTHADHIFCAGPTLDDTGTTMNGSVLIMDFPDIAQARTFADNDPYFKAGLFAHVTVRRWKKVFPTD